MFQVQPVRSKELQKSLAEALGCPYFDDTYAFYAGELSDDATQITSLIGLCQFTYAPQKAVIRNVAVMPGCEEDEAVTILVRAVMAFLHHAEIPTVGIEPDAAPEKKIRAWGFRPLPPPDGMLAIDLEKFYRSPCHYSDEES